MTQLSPPQGTTRASRVPGANERSIAKSLYSLDPVLQTRIPTMSVGEKLKSAKSSPYGAIDQ